MLRLWEYDTAKEIGTMPVESSEYGACYWWGEKDTNILLINLGSIEVSVLQCVYM